jgi:hypothetical protein
MSFAKQNNTTFTDLGPKKTFAKSFKRKSNAVVSADK